MIKHIDRLFSAVVLGALLVYLVDAIAPKLEGRFFPVASQVVLYDPVPHVPPAYQYVWKGRAQKLRDCEFVALDWYLGKRGGGRVGIAAKFLDAPQVRRTGLIQFERIVIALEKDALISNSHADVIHKCPWRPWQTRTPFYH